MSSLNITVEIKDPGLWLIKTQKIKGLSCLRQNAEAPAMSGAHCLALARSTICILHSEGPAM